MKLRGTVLAGVTAATLLVSGAVLAAVINELPQDAVPIQEPTAALNRQTPAQAPPIESAAEAEPASVAPVAVTQETPPTDIAAADQSPGAEEPAV
jgi:outer membrane murein-binding lipoprotein Lpp